MLHALQIHYRTSKPIFTLMRRKQFPAAIFKLCSVTDNDKQMFPKSVRIFSHRSQHQQSYRSSFRLTPSNQFKPLDHLTCIFPNFVYTVSQEYKVDLALWGHHHLYHRSCPVYQEVCVDQGTIHVVIGMSGHSLSDSIE